MACPFPSDQPWYDLDLCGCGSRVSVLEVHPSVLVGRGGVHGCCGVRNIGVRHCSDFVFSLLHLQQAPKKATGKKVAAAPGAQKKAPAKAGSTNPLFEKRTRNFGIGGDLPPKRDLSRYVKWPKYIRLQRQKAVLLQRLKVPPSLNQFTKTLDKHTGMRLVFFGFGRFSFLGCFFPQYR